MTTAALMDVVSKARLAANSWTMTTEQALAVAIEADERRAESVHDVWDSIHKRLWQNRGWYPSAREVAAICRAVHALPQES